MRMLRALIVLCLSSLAFVSCEDFEVDFDEMYWDTIAGSNITTNQHALQFYNGVAGGKAFNISMEVVGANTSVSVKSSGLSQDMGQAHSIRVIGLNCGALRFYL